MTQVIVFGLPNMLLLFCALIPIALYCIITLKAIQTSSNTKQVYGRKLHQFVKMSGFIQLITSFLLVSRASIKTTYALSNMSTMTQGVWSVTRLTMIVISSMCGMLSHAHFIFRWIFMLLQPLLMTCDLISELYLANDIACLQRNICAPDASRLLWNRVFVVRDLISIAAHTSGILLGGALHWHLGLFSTLALPLTVEEREFSKPMSEWTHAADVAAVQGKRVIDDGVDADTSSEGHSKMSMSAALKQKVNNRARMDAGPLADISTATLSTSIALKHRPRT